MVWETVGRAMFETCARHLAIGGRLLVIGLMSVYSSGWPQSQVCSPAVFRTRQSEPSCSMCQTVAAVSCPACLAACCQHREAALACTHDCSLPTRHCLEAGSAAVYGWSVAEPEQSHAQVTGLPERLLNKSASVRGFFLPHHGRLFKAHFARLLGALQSGKLKAALDPTPFRCCGVLP